MRNNNNNKKEWLRLCLLISYIYYNGLWKQQYPEGSKGHGGRRPHEKVWQPGNIRRVGWQNSETLLRFLLSKKRFSRFIVRGREADWRGPSSGTTGQIYIDLLGWAASGESERRKKKGERELCASRRRRVGEIYTRTSSAASSSQREKQQPDRSWGRSEWSCGKALWACIFIPLHQGE